MQLSEFLTASRVQPPSLRLLSLPDMAQKLLALGAHPDDVEFGCAALLIKEVKRGCQVKILVLSRGEAGSAGTPEQREQESREAAKCIGAEIGFLDFGGDCHIECSIPNAIRIAQHIREYQPAILLAPALDGNQHPDHARVGRLGRDAARLARYGSLEELKGLPPHGILSLYYYNITGDLNRKPDMVVDVSEEKDQWERAMLCHDTQTGVKRYIDMILTRARLLGFYIGTEYAAGVFLNDPIRLEALSDIHLSSRTF